MEEGPDEQALDADTWADCRREKVSSDSGRSLAEERKEYLQREQS